MPQPLSNRLRPGRAALLLFVYDAGIPVLGVPAIFERAEDLRAHGLDERVGADEYHDAVEFRYRMLKRLGQESPRVTGALAGAAEDPRR